MENVSLRYFNIFGPRQDPGSPYSGVLSRFAAAVLEDTPPLIYGDGEQTRDFTFVDNAVQANLLAFEAPGASGKVYNVGTGFAISLNKIVELLRSMSGKKIEPKHDPPREGDIRDSLADIGRAKEDLGYEPTVLFEAGLRRTFEWYRTNHVKAPAPIKETTK